MVQAFSEVLLKRTLENRVNTTSSTSTTRAKLIYHGFDNDERFVKITLEALNDVRSMHTHKNKTDACGSKDTNVDLVIEVDVQHVDITGGDSLLPFFPRPMDFAFVSVGHILYYAQKPSGIERVAESVIQLLGKRSMAMFVHSAHHCNLAMLRESVSPSAHGAHEHDAAVIARPSIYIGDIAKERQWELISIVVPYWIQFPCITSQQWKDCKDPRRYKLRCNRDSAEFVILLELLMFIAQRSLQDLADEGVLGTFVDAVQGNLDDDNRFVGLTDYQFILSPFQFSSEEVDDIKDAVATAVRNVCRPVAT